MCSSNPALLRRQAGAEQPTLNPQPTPASCHWVLPAPAWPVSGRGYPDARDSFLFSALVLCR